MFRSLCAAAALLALSGCDNWMAKHWGGTLELHAEPGTKVINVTWKNEDIWVVTRPMRDDEHAEVVTFREYSRTGILSGKVVVHETDPS